MTCDNQTIYERVVQLALRESTHYNRLCSVWRSESGVLLIRTAHIPEPGDVLLGQTVKREQLHDDHTVTRWWAYEPRVSAEQVAAAVGDEPETIAIETVTGPSPELTSAAVVSRQFVTVRLVEDLSADELRAPGSWKPLTLRTNNGGGTHSATVKCPQCGQVASLIHHVINDNGVVEPQVECPNTECSFSGKLQLEGWSEEA
jgi:hypothetical protein